MEEDLRPRLIPISPEDLERRALRGFGLGLGILLFILAWRAHAQGRSASAFAVLSVVSLLLSRAKPAAFGPLYRLWMPVVGVLARVNLWLVCAILYYLVVTPYGLLLRGLGLSPLALKLRDKDSYWEVKPARDPVESSRHIF
ncbi:MAG: hypothetical protein ABL955_08025 [Elusimicrobiota bacterium]